MRAFPIPTHQEKLLLISDFLNVSNSCNIADNDGQGESGGGQPGEGKRGQDRRRKEGQRRQSVRKVLETKIHRFS